MTSAAGANAPPDVDDQPDTTAEPAWRLDVIATASALLDLPGVVAAAGDDLNAIRGILEDWRARLTTEEGTLQAVAEWEPAAAAFAPFLNGVRSAIDLALMGDLSDEAIGQPIGIAIGLLAAYIILDSRRAQASVVAAGVPLH